MKTIPRKTDRMKFIEFIHNESLEEILRTKFVDEHKSTAQIAKELGIAYMTAFRWLLKAGIYSRALKI